MPASAFRLQTVLEIRSGERTIARQAAFEAQEEFERARRRLGGLRAERQAISEQIQKLSARGSIDIRALKSAYDSEAKLKSAIAVEEARLETLADQLSKRRQSLFSER